MIKQEGGDARSRRWLNVPCQGIKNHVLVSVFELDEVKKKWRGLLRLKVPLDTCSFAISDAPAARVFRPGQRHFSSRISTAQST